MDIGNAVVNKSGDQGILLGGSGSGLLNASSVYTQVGTSRLLHRAHLAIQPHLFLIFNFDQAADG